MKQSSTLFLKIAVCLFGLIVLIVCVSVLPRAILSGKTGAYLPILLGMYVPAIPFFIALYHGMKLLGRIDKNDIFSPVSIRSLRFIKYCGFFICISYTIGMPYIFLVAEHDDAPGVAVLGFIFIFSSLVVATASALFQHLLQNVIDIKSENELTV